MKKGQAKVPEREIEFENHPPCRDQIEATKDAMGVSEGIQDQILTTVAQKMWERDVIQTHKQSYISKWSTSYGFRLLNSKPDDRQDDSIITPRGTGEEEPAPLEKAGQTSKSATALGLRGPQVDHFPNF